LADNLDALFDDVANSVTNSFKQPLKRKRNN